MKLVVLGAVLVALTGSASADQFVNGYFKNDGSYVAPHFKSDANQWRFDNYSSQGNTNPYTGERGYGRHEFTNPPAYNSGNGYGGFRNYDGYGTRPKW